MNDQEEILYKKYAKEPDGYIQWHAFARDQEKHGISQFRCTKCKRFIFPQSVMKHSKEGCESRPTPKEGES